MVAGENGLKAVLELLHLFVTEPCWTEGAMYRAKQAFRSHYLSLPKSLERSTADLILTSMLGSDRWATCTVRFEGATKVTRRARGKYMVLENLVVTRPLLTIPFPLPSSRLSAAAGPSALSKIQCNMVMLRLRLA